MKDLFPNETDWSMIFRARTEHPGRRREALDVIARQYWQPVYSFFLRSCGNADKAMDLTQGFFMDLVLGRDLFGKADPKRGQLRSLLLKALQNYEREKWRWGTAAKRSPSTRLVSLDRLEDELLPEPVAGATAEQAFMLTWASCLITETLDEVKARCLMDDMGAHWKAFSAKYLQSESEEPDPPDVPPLITAAANSHKPTPSSMAITVERRFRKALREKLLRLLPPEDRTEAGIEAEIDELLRAYAQFRASSSR